MPSRPLKSNRPRRITQIILPCKVIIKTERFLKRIGEGGEECIAYWTGVFKDEKALVKDVLFPSEFSTERSWGFAHVNLETAFKIGELIHKKKQFLLVQLHTHPFEAFHSFTDDKYPISHRVGFLSVVIPYFAREPLDDMRTWKVYEYKGTGRWRELTFSEITKKFLILNER